MEAGFNVVRNWKLWCYEQTEHQNCITLRCTMNSPKKSGGGYTPSIFFEVVCIPSRCEIEKDSYVKGWVYVDGQFYPDETITKDGKNYSKNTIFGDWVTKTSHNQ
ncbi:MAG: hypothetical protein IJK26_09170 [Clostridia bacterium]|nr:hypothetical protein [Clostridia bacterium]